MGSSVLARRAGAVAAAAVIATTGAMAVAGAAGASTAHPKVTAHYRLEFRGTPRLISSRSRVVTVKG